jgi:hypothetical protein
MMLKKRIAVRTCFPARLHKLITRRPATRFAAGWCRYLFLFCLYGLFTVFFSAGLAQTLQVSGTVRDSVTQSPLANVSVYAGRGSGTRTDANGFYRLQLNNPPTSIRFLLTGYRTLTRPLGNNPVQHIDAELSRLYTQLEDVTVSTRQTGKYSNKHNPAVELIRQVIAHKPQNEIGAYPTASYNQYEKLCMYLDKFPSWIANNKLLKQYRFVFDNKDTTKIPGKKLTPIYLEETFSRNYFRREPEKKNKVVLGEKKVDYGEFIDTRGISTILNRLYEDINIYDNHIVVFTRQFISPIAASGPVFYKYFIRDTLTENNQRFVRLFFMPRNPADLLFTGTLYITLDGRYAVTRLNMQTGKRINLGLVRSLLISQQFTQDSSMRYHLSYSNVMADYGLTRGGSGMFGERTVSITGFETGQPIADSLFKKQPELYEQHIRSQPDSFWVLHRTDTLSHPEAKTYYNIDSLHRMKSYIRTTDYVNMFLVGYKSLGPAEIGPINSFLSYNPIEGYKPRLGGRTTTHLSTRYYLEGYGAYGLRDHQWKYFGRITYALNNKSVYTYPLHYIRASYRRDTNIPGTDDEYVEDNIFFSVKRGNNTRYLYNHIFRLDYLREFGDHISYNLGFKYKQQQPSGSLYFIKGNSNSMDTLSSLRTAELSLVLRWAPHEQFYQSKINRANITNRYPIFTLAYIRGVKGLMGGQYNYNNYNFNVFKRFYLAPFGYSDVSLSAGYVSGRLPWPLMIIHSGNQGFIYSGSSYNMMNYLEFVSDHYASLSVDHYFKGFFFNRVPLLRRMKLREVLAGKILFGGVRAENKPGGSSGQVLFPTTNNVVTTYTLDKQPYLEASAGITHIFKVLRVDLIRRFTYLSHPDITKWGLRASFNLEL